MRTIADDVTGVLLAGGRSRRMFAQHGGGGDKGLLAIGGKPMIAHVIARLAPQVGHLVINANGDPARFSNFGLPIVADTIEGFAGPLAGVLAGMRWSIDNAPEAAFVATVSTDVPFLPADLVRRLRDASAAAHDTIAVAASGGDVHPVIGLWPVKLAGDLEGALRQGTRRVSIWAERHDAVVVDFAPVVIGTRSIDPFFNANTPAELDEARALLQT